MSTYFYITYLECVGKWTNGQKPREDFSRFRSVTRGEPPKWNDVVPYVQFMINNGVSVNGVKCFDQLTDQKFKKCSEKVASMTKSSSVY